MQIHINPGDRLPVYRQIERQITDAIAEARLRPGERLVPLRELAEHLVVSPLAVQRAYAELATGGLCERCADGGWRVAESPVQELQPAWRRRLASPRQRRLLIEELEMASRIQSRLLPPAETAGGSWSVAARSLPAAAVAGDFYDVLPQADGGVVVVVGDVAGKGLGASLVMASVKAMLPFIATGLTVEETLRELNRRLYSDLGRRQFVALALARLHPGRGLVEVADAGLPDPYLLRIDRAPLAVAPPGPRLPLGLRPEVPYEVVTLPMSAGDRLILLSDGIPEAPGPGGEPLGYEFLSNLVAARAAAPRTPAAWLDGLLEAVRRSSRREIEDDWTALLLEARTAEQREHPAGAVAAPAARRAR